MKGTIFWRFLCFFIEDNIVILWDEMGGSGRIWDLCREKRAISTDKHGGFTRANWKFHQPTWRFHKWWCQKIDGIHSVSTAVIVILLFNIAVYNPKKGLCCVLWDGGPGWPAQYPQPTGATRGQGWTISMDSSGRFVTTACAGTCWACLQRFVLNFVRSQ